ncbi:putative DNA-binding domain-containing protein [Aliikangiella coralliicola]|uniref:DUF2063 domain-containing protein n=1 Tax=Aliikangiella coralliicola TaxID=2592383 RepID=A0A545UCY1_9GAMM|nr:putative DNA-binding domain-containing protein [Aliikangiella coralliicola]TQV87318.1 DUF2063 domain-containing protein [Aliikangiella coralliicola]
MRLAQWQATLFNQIVSPNEDLLQPDFPGSDIVPDNAFNESRISIYRNNVIGGLESWIRNIYSNTHSLLGDYYFSVLCRCYISEVEPVAKLDNNFAEKLPEYIGQFTQKKIYTLEISAKTDKTKMKQRLKSLPQLMDVARLDWILQKSYYADKRKTWPQNDFLKLSPKQQAHLTFNLSPDINWLSSAWDLPSLLRLNVEQTLSPETDPSIQSVQSKSSRMFLLVERPQIKVKIKQVSQAEFDLLNLIKQNYSLSDIALQADHLSTFVARLIEHGWIDGFTPRLPDIETRFRSNQ